MPTLTVKALTVNPTKSTMVKSLRLKNKMPTGKKQTASTKKSAGRSGGRTNWEDSPYYALAKGDPALIRELEGSTTSAKRSNTKRSKAKK
jgi:hypothetical protein